MRLNKGIIVGLGLLTLAIALHAQSISTISESAPDSIVRFTAESQGLELISPELLPRSGTFWVVTSNGLTAPYPCLPNDSISPVYSITDGIYLVDDTGGQVNPKVRSSLFQSKSDTLTTALEALAGSVADLISQVQDTELVRGMAMAFGMEEEMELDSSESFSPLFAVTDTNSLWLEITNVANGWSYVNLHNSTNQVYEIWSKTNLLAAQWNIEQEVWPLTNQTVTPFTVPTLNRDNLFLWARDWTGIDENSNNVPDWWEWKYFGATNVAVTNLDFANSSRTFAKDYSNSITPRVFAFDSVETTNTYFNTSQITAQINVSGWPYYVASQVDGVNFSNAVWSTYASSNVTVNSGLTEGWHDVWVGLRGHAENPSAAAWRQKWVKLDFTPPVVIITNPTSHTVSVPLIQLQGLVNEELSRLTYDVSNATGIFTNLTGYTTEVFYDTNQLTFTTNSFQCYDIGLTTNGVNVITLHATDLAGNTTTTNFNVTVDYSTATTPVSAPTWPLDGTPIGGSNFIFQASVSDPTATVTVSIVDTNGNTNVITGKVSRNGQISLNQIPLGNGANNITVTTTGASGLNSTTNFTVVRHDVGLVITPLTGDQLNQSTVTVTGLIGDPSYSLTVNGVAATVTGNAWSADGVPVSPTGMASFYVEVKDTSGNVIAAQDSKLQQPVAVYVASYEFADKLTGRGDISAYWDSTTGGEFNDSESITDLYPDDMPDPFNYEWEYAEVNEAGGVPPAAPWAWYWHMRTKVVLDLGVSQQTGMKTYLVRAEAFEPGFHPLPYQPLPPEWLQIRDQNLVNSGVAGDDYGYFSATVWGETIVQAPAGEKLDITPVATRVYDNYWDYIFNVQAVELNLQLAVDNNRDGQIALDANDDTSASNPFRFWINDSKEHGDDLTADGADFQIPGLVFDGFFNNAPNYAYSHVQGRSDLVNYFPVALCLSNTLQLLPLTNGYEYHLSQADNAVRFVYSSLTPTNALDYLTNTASTGYGANADEDVAGADTVLVSGVSGTTLDANWLAHVQDNGGTGIILMEGRAASTKPLMLEIWRNGQKLGGVPLYLKISGVEQMFRHLNLSLYGNGVNTVDSRYDAPNEPETKNANLVFLHGYNVNQQQARGVQSEMFKRFYWSGSKAKFYGVTWNGSVSQGDLIPGISCNLQTNIVNAFLTAPHLASFLGTLSGETTVAAHSLGNMVVLSAISDHNAQPARHFMIDAAVAMEAVQGSTPFEPAMIPSAWQNYSNRTFASDWWRLFPTNDARSTLTWNNRLGNLGSVDIYNFFSLGEEVLREDTDDPPPGILSGGVTQLINIWAGVAQGAYAWVWQEKGKGNALHDDFVSSTHGGWRFPVNQYGDSIPVPPATANSLSGSTLQQTPVFNFGSYYDPINGSFPDLALTNTSGSTYAQAHRDRILSDTIPALTLPVGANHVDRFAPQNGDDKNFNMQTSFETGWPVARSNPADDEAFKWHHSDFDYVAYPFTHNLFDKIVNTGNLK